MLRFLFCVKTNLLHAGSCDNFQYYLIFRSLYVTCFRLLNIYVDEKQSPKRGAYFLGFITDNNNFTFQTVEHQGAIYTVVWSPTFRLQFKAAETVTEFLLCTAKFASNVNGNRYLHFTTCVKDLFNMNENIIHLKFAFLRAKLRLKTKVNMEPGFSEQ